MKPIKITFTIIFLSSLLIQGQASLKTKKKSKDNLDRNIITFPKPQYSPNDSGIVVVNLWIDKNGDILNVALDSIATTTKQSSTIEKTIKAAYTAKFTPIKQDTIQIGTISFNFEIY